RTSAVASPETGAPALRCGAPSTALPSSTISTYGLRRAPCIRSVLATTHHAPVYETGSGMSTVREASGAPAAAPQAKPHTGSRVGWIVAGLVALCAALIAAPAPAGLPEAGKRVIAVAVLAIGLWCTEALPAGVTSLVLIVALVLSGAVPGFREALSGFADPVAYFL